MQRALATADRLIVGDVTAACYVRGAHGVGGDIVDLMEVNGCLLAVLGDVSGKGAPAALVAAMLLASVQHHVEDIGAQPGLLLTAVGRSMRGVLDRTGTIVTLVIAAVDPAAHALRVASAGHHPVVLGAQGRSARVDPICPPLGADVPCGAEVQVEFGPGATLVLASDGVTEQCDSLGREFGLARLHDVALDGRSCSPRTIISNVIGAVDTHAGSMPVSDDRALVVLRSGAAT